MNKIFFLLIFNCILQMQGIYAQQTTKTSDKIIKIGLLVSNTKSLASQNAAEMAISKANEKEGPDGLHFQLVVRSMEGPWGKGSKEAVNLIFKENVWAIIGSHDSRNAHLVEQVISKTGIVFISAWASDPTLSQAFIPWFFSCVPNDIQQAETFINEIYNNRKITKIAIVSDKAYDSNLAVQSLLKEIKIAGKAEPKKLFYDSYKKDFNILMDEIYKAGINGIILFGQSSASFSFIQQLRQRKMNQPVFGSLSLLGEVEFDNLDLAHYDQVNLITSGNWFELKSSTFQNEYQNKYGKRPNALAAYTFDSTNLIIEAIKTSGPDREKIQKIMSKTSYNGVTGRIQFDGKGNRIKAAQLIKLNNGILATFE